MAFRHLMKNNVIKSIPHSKKHPELFHNYVFDNHNLDIRPEDPYYGNYRVAVSMNSNDLPVVISKSVEKKIRFHLSKFLIGKTGNHDLIITPKSLVFFSNDIQISSEISLLFSKSKEYYTNFPNTTPDLNTEDLYYKTLKEAYKYNESEFFTNFAKISLALNDSSSPISQILSISKKQNYDSSKVAVELRKWCRSNSIFNYFYKFISNVHKAILIYESALNLLPRLLRKSEIDKKITP